MRTIFRFLETFVISTAKTNETQYELLTLMLTIYYISYISSNALLLTLIMKTQVILAYQLSPAYLRIP